MSLKLIAMVVVRRKVEMERMGEGVAETLGRKKGKSVGFFD